jgi:hypothetical protein
VATQTSLQDASGIISASSIMTVQLRAVGKDVVVNGLTVTPTGFDSVTYSGISSPQTVVVGTPLTVTVSGSALVWGLNQYLQSHRTEPGPKRTLAKAEKYSAGLNPISLNRLSRL